MQKIVYINCDRNSQHWAELEKLFQGEWPDFTFFDTYIPDTKLPPVIIALRNNEVIGGLAYSHYQEPHQTHEVIWLNAVFVCHDWRGQGIASELIRRGVRQVSANTQHHLYVYTNVAPLYQSLGWSVVDIESEPNHTVMRVSLNPK